MYTGHTITWERTFTRQDVEYFCELSGDKGEHHLIPDDDGRLIVQGLLTATLPTKIGGDYNVFARNMQFNFLRPVFTGDTITCTVTITQYEKQETRINISSVFECTNQNDKKVLEGSFEGIIKAPLHE
ncbi:hotdog domain-containing protein [Aneurinibacillus sp. Ricciae_BoGa-3]|uniref:hotdog domain-containing protein n=1 Tax=Aneurinibacillus sp. Ricciae_BoGa-3 TaxID=3022697 RepID=UPI002340F7A0|nr:hotdog domain-containing protein [Aneurinibacillus sp. Ricciae_BoGa-3]WCK55514.1 hotdog domain-containing protein [Aneurinibacillus sp. Ricciae_BoGa-3]